MAAKRIGRPPLPDDQRKTRVIPFRCREDLYELLVKAAAEGRRTLSQELELRVSNSFGAAPEAPEPKGSNDAERLAEAYVALDRMKDLAKSLSKVSVRLLELSKTKKDDQS